MNGRKRAAETRLSRCPRQGDSSPRDRRLARGRCWGCRLRSIPPRHCGRRTRGLLFLVVLRCALDRWYPTLAPLHPDLGFGLQLERRLIQTSEPNLDERVAGVGRVDEPRPTAGAEAATVIARDLAAQLERLDRPLRIHAERTAGLLSAIRAVATPDMHRVTSNGVANRPAETSAVCVLLPPRADGTQHCGAPVFGNVPRASFVRARVKSAQPTAASRCAKA